MISDNRINKIEKPETKVLNSEEKEQKSDDFDALIDEFFSAYIPVNIQTQTSPKLEKNDGFKNESRTEIENLIPVNLTENQFLSSNLNPNGAIELQDFSQFDKKLKVDFKSDFNIEKDVNSEKNTDILPFQSSDLQKSDSENFQNPAENIVKDFEIVIDKPIEKTQKVDFASQNLFETALRNEKSESAPKLPKLFSEVSGLLEVHQQNKNLQIPVSDQVQPVDTNKTFIEQIEPRLLELAAITTRTNEKQILKMKLHPAELGMVEIKIEKNKNGKLTAHFQTESDAAKQILTENLDQLRDSLQNSGWEIENMEITSDSSTSFENRENSSRQSETTENNSVKTSVFSGDSNNSTDLKDNILSRLLSLRA